MPPADKSSELFIDALRGIAALMVLLAHAIMLGLRGVYESDSTGLPEGWHWLRASVGSGGYWVWAFFVISGFCIQQSVRRSVEKGTYSWGGYVSARVTRIYPLFLLGLGLAVGGWWLTGGYAGRVPEFPWLSFVASLFMLQYFVQPFPSFAPSWSLTNEMVYYLLWPLGLTLTRGSSRRAVVLLTGGTLAVTLGLFVIWKIFHAGRGDSFLVPCWSVSALFVLWLGGAWLGANWQRWSAWMTRRVWLLAMGWLVGVYVLMAVLQFRESRTALLLLGGYLATPGFMLLIAGGGFLRLGEHARMARLARWLGLLSYPCYILHKPLMWLADTVIVPALPDWLTVLPAVRIALLLAPPLVAVALIGPPLERRFMAWRKRVLAAKPALAPSGAAPI